MVTVSMLGFSACAGFQLVIRKPPSRGLNRIEVLLMERSKVQSVFTSMQRSGDPRLPTNRKGSAQRGKDSSEAFCKPNHKAARCC